tara:strand:- start:25523 stop:26137 length:615 start_codon:yes stop_codon:yes gene_type:complete
MMSTSNPKYLASAVREDRCRRRPASRPRIGSLLVASILVAVPMPAFAQSGPGDNIAISLSSRIAGNLAGQGAASAVVAGTIVDFSVVVTGPSGRGTPATSFAISDKVPDHLSLFVGDLEMTGSGPATFSDYDSGLEFSFDGLSSLDDAVEFSSNGGKTFDYVPVADPDGFDANVTHIRLRPRGTLLATSGHSERFSFRYRMKVK